MTVLLIEGVVATGKTTLLVELQKTDLWQSLPTKFVLSEHYTERVLELTAPDTDARLQLLSRHVNTAEYLHTLWSSSRFKDQVEYRPHMLCERFHLTHAAQINDFEPFRSLDERLKAVGAVLLLLYHPEQALLTRIKDTIPIRPPKWQRWLNSLGNEEDIARYFLSLQYRSMSFFYESRLKKIALEAHSVHPQDLAVKVARLMFELSQV